MIDEIGPWFATFVAGVGLVLWRWTLGAKLVRRLVRSRTTSSALNDSRR